MTQTFPDEVLHRIRSSSPGDLSAAEYGLLARRLESLLEDSPPVRLIFLASFTTTLLDPYLRVEGARHGLRLDVVHGGYGQFEQALLGGIQPTSGDAQEALVVLMRLEDLDPDFPFRFYRKGGADDELMQGALTRLEGIADTFRERSSGPVLIANFSPPPYRPLTVFDAGHAHSVTHSYGALNRALADRLSGRAGVYVWDYAGLVASYGALGWVDPRLEALARAPLAAASQPALAHHLTRTLRGVLRPSAKCLVVDLDDTLWGGAVGDEGPSGIALGDEHPGRAFKGFQRAILGLRDRGILLAICSNNDEEIALEALNRHPEMLVRQRDFSSIRIDWRPKSEGLREIAAELNIGLDALILFDDNPVVRAEVRRQLPQVTVVEVPSDPVLYVRALSRVVELDSPGLTREDLNRAESVIAERERGVAKGGAQSLDEFLASLEMVAEIGAIDGTTAPRVSQLVAKTNQFNLTTRRHSQAELERLSARSDAYVCWLRLSDRYGDMGLIAVGVLTVEDSSAVVESLVMSCRAANRGVERTLLSHMVSRARERGCKRLVGEYIPSARNHVVKDLYAQLGFRPSASIGDVTRFTLDLFESDLQPPEFMEVRTNGTAEG